MKFILGKKLGMTTIYEKGKALNVTLIECEPNKISFVRTKEKDGYDSVQLKINKTKNQIFRREFRLSEKNDVFQLDQEIKIDSFQIGDMVKISGTTKAKGFQGVMKRHGFKGSKRSHGHKHDWRAPGSVGAQQPQHVIKGKRMAGRMGGVKSTSKNIKLVFIDKENRILGFRGAVPGVAGRIVEVMSK